MLAIRLLLIDDEEDFLEIFGEWLRFKGFDVSTAFDGMDGLEKLHSGSYDLILLDLMMPRLDGLEFCKLVKSDKLFQDIPILVLTAMTRLGFGSAVKAVGADAFVEKMADHAEIDSAIRKVLEKKKGAGRAEMYN
ncbi:MAG: response regulator [bacterium]